MLRATQDAFSVASLASLGIVVGQQLCVELVNPGKFHYARKVCDRLSRRQPHVLKIPGQSPSE